MPTVFFLQRNKMRMIPNTIHHDTICLITASVINDNKFRAFPYSFYDRIPTFHYPSDVLFLIICRNDY